MPANVGKPVRNWDRILLRVPDGMKDDLADMAAESCRALNGQIIHLLKRGLEAEKTASNHTA